MYDTLAELTHSLRATLEGIQAETMERRKGELPAALRFYKTIKDEYDDFEAVRKKIGETLESLSRGTIPEMMAEEGVRTITLDDIGYRFTISHRWSCTLLEKDVGIDWLKSHGHEALVFETVNAQTLAAWAKKMVDEEGKEPDPAVFKTGTMAFTSVTKAR